MTNAKDPVRSKIPVGVKDPVRIDLLLTNAAVITMNAQMEVFKPGAMAVRGSQIVAVGPASAIAAQYQATENIDCAGRALIPGLVNAHTHVAMTLLRGLADDLRLDVWLMGYVLPVEREFVSPDFSRLGTLLACAEMIRSGVTCFADMYYYEEHVARATATAGLRAVCSQTVMKFPTPDAGSYEDGLARAREFILDWNDHPLIVPSVGPHAPYTCPPDILKACTALAAETKTPLHIHISETAFEVEDSVKHHGLRVVPWVEKQGLFEARVLAAHCVHIDRSEMRTLQHHGAGVAHCPSSNLKIASGFAPVGKMLESGLNVGIGTDGAASNNDLDMFEETHLAALVAKAVNNDPTVLPAKKALEMATIMGARALTLDAITGSLEAGKRADFALVDLYPLHDTPHFERDPNALYARLVYASKSTDVTDVMVEGRWLMRERKLLTLDEAELKRAAEEYARRIDTFLIQLEQSVLSKLVASGGLEQEESFEVQVKARVSDPAKVADVLGTLQVIRKSRYHEFDTYFIFAEAQEGSLRYREDEFIDDKGQVSNVRYRLTLTGPAKEHQYENSVFLSRSRFIAPAQHSLRFYREYFRPVAEREVEKDRQRWLVLYKNIEFFINLDRLIRPAREGYYLEIKSRTYSKRDAEEKAHLIGELLARFDAQPEATVQEEYVALASEPTRRS